MILKQVFMLPEEGPCTCVSFRGGWRGSVTRERLVSEGGTELATPMWQGPPESWLEGRPDSEPTLKAIIGTLW